MLIPTSLKPNRNFKHLKIMGCLEYEVFPFAIFKGELLVLGTVEFEALAIYTMLPRRCKRTGE